MMIMGFNDLEWGHCELFLLGFLDSEFLNYTTIRNAISLSYIYMLYVRLGLRMHISRYSNFYGVQWATMG
jgi:hypothetical protein